jgi:hypothetical protein
MCRILGRKLPGPEMKVLESGTRLGDEGSPGTDRLVTDSAECSNLTGVSSLSLFLCHHMEEPDLTDPDAAAVRLLFVFTITSLLLVFMMKFVRHSRP